MPKIQLSPKMRRARLWLLSAVVVGLFPLASDMFHNIDLHKHQDLHGALATGDALVLSAALAGGCVYDMLTTKVRAEKEDTRNVLILAAVVLAIFAGLWFGDMQNNTQGARNEALWTLLYLLGTILICIRALFLSYDSEMLGPSAAPVEPKPAEQKEV